MKNAASSTKKLAALLKKIGQVDPPQLPDAGDPVAALVMSMLMWESTTEKAVAAYNRIMASVVDFNDLRVCMPHETLEMIGSRYPRGMERAERLRAVLRNIYLREHAMSLAKVATANKREIKKYIESLEGITPYAASRVLLLNFDMPCIPVDEQLLKHLIEAEVADESTEITELSAWLAGQAKPGEATILHYSLQAWSDQNAEKPATAKKTTVKRSTPRRTSSRSSSRYGSKSAAG